MEVNEKVRRERNAFIPSYLVKVGLLKALGFGNRCVWAEELKV